MDATTLWLLLATVLVLTGVAGLVLPVLPGIVLVFAGLLLAAWAEQFAHVGLGTLVLLGALALLATAVDLVAGALGAKRYGASPRAVLGAGIGALIGIAFGLIGIVIGPLVGAVLGELSALRTLGEASRAGLGTVLGMAIGAAAKIAVALTMIGIFLFMRLVA